jgi:tRNA (cmo5U34)-methyltransferase
MTSPLQEASRGVADTLFATPRRHLVDFAFDEAVARVFPDMIRRSVPGYTDVIALSGLIATHLTPAAARIYDLGCSRGATSLAILDRMQGDDAQLIAVDSAPAMIDHCRQELASHPRAAQLQLICGDIRQIELLPAHSVVMNYTLQFIPLPERLPLLVRIFNALQPGGVLLLAEKIAVANRADSDLLQQLHHAFKRANGYSDLEISQKRSALERVLLPESIETHQQRLAQAGFGQIAVWHQSLNFVALVALKATA